MISEIVSSLNELEQQLLDALAHCEKTKKPGAPPQCDRSNIPAGYWMDARCELHRNTKFSGDIINLGILGVGGPPVEVTPGGALTAPSKTNPGPKRRPKNVDELSWKLQLAIWECQEKTARVNARYFRCLAQEGGSPAGCKNLFVQVSCPEVKRLEELVAARNAASSTKTKRTSDFHGQGGQFGGGGASGTF